MLEAGYDTNDRMAAPEADCVKMERLEVVFDIPVFMTQSQQRRLTDVLEEISRAAVNQPKAGVHWLSGCGSKPKFSKADAAFLDRPADEDAPDDGEPTFDDSVMYYQTTARPFLSEKERDRIMLERCPSAKA